MAHPASVIDLIGNTPLIRLDRASEDTGCEILGKAEFLNPGGSLKDRAALGLVRAAEASGALRPGGTIVEGTAGNTGIGLAMVGAALGYKVVIIFPRNQSEEKKAEIRMMGATLIEVDGVPYSNPKHFARWSGEYTRQLNEANPGSAVWTQQFDNVANRDFHAATTGLEIWDQTVGKIDGFVCSVGSGGTLGGVSNALKAKNKDIQIGLADPGGAALYGWYTHGELKGEGSSITEGIGQSRVTANLADVVVDRAYRISDEIALPIVFDLVEKDGLCLGGSSGVNIGGAIEMAKEMGPGHTIVTLLCDHGSRYQSKLYNAEFLKQQGLPLAGWMT